MYERFEVRDGLIFVKYSVVRGRVVGLGFFKVRILRGI